jgi:hypothetical protein
VYFGSFEGVLIERSSSLEKTEELLFGVWRENANAQSKCYISHILRQDRGQNKLAEWMSVHSR